MQRSGATPTAQNAPNFFSSSFFSSSSTSKSRPGTRDGDQQQLQQQSLQPNLLTKEPRKGSFGRKTSFSSPSKAKRRANSSSGNVVVTDRNIPPALPDFALAAAAKISRETEAIQSPASADSFSRMLGRTQPTPTGYGPGVMLAPQPSLQSSEAGMVHMQIQEIANKRISTLDYLRKAHEGRVYWFNTLLFDKPDLQRLPYFDSRKLARRATNYLLLGLSLPTVVDLNSNTPLEFLRSLNTLLHEFESFQQLHGENGSSAGSLTRARLPQMFRRAPGGKSRRSASGAANDIGYPMDSDSIGGGYGGIGSSASASASVMSFAASETDLLPGEEYVHLLTPSLPFEPDFFETFATLCDVLIDVYTRLLSLIPTPRETTAPVAELFAKADSKVRKIIINGVVKEFEDNSRAQIKMEVGNIGKVVLGGLM